MENASEAIKIAGSILLFVIAVSVIIFSFTNVRVTADTILDYRDRETVYIDGKYYYEASGTERQVGLETVIPSIIRAYTENYKIVFVGLSSPIYKIKQNDGNIIEKYSLDLESNINTPYENVRLANNDQKSEFLCGILYHNYKTNEEDFNKKFGITVSDNSLYEQLNEQLKIKNKTIKEFLGVYYQDDSEDMPDVNKTEKRIITYEITNNKGG